MRRTRKSETAAHCQGAWSPCKCTKTRKDQIPLDGTPVVMSESKPHDSQRTGELMRGNAS